MARSERLIHTSKEERPRVLMRGDTLEEGQRIADSVTSRCSELGRVEKGIDRYYLLQQRRHDACSQLASFHNRYSERILLTK